jgi:hypothetical protein
MCVVARLHLLGEADAATESPIGKGAATRRATSMPPFGSNGPSYTLVKPDTSAHTCFRRAKIENFRYMLFHAVLRTLTYEVSLIK